MTTLGQAYDLLRMSDSALYYHWQAYNTYSGLDIPPLWSLILSNIGNSYAIINKKDSALMFYHRALSNAIQWNIKIHKSEIEKKIADLYNSTQAYDSSLQYARLALLSGQQVSQKLQILQATDLLVKLHLRNGRTDSAFFYQDLGMVMKDSLFGAEKFKQLQKLVLQEQEQQQAILQDQERFRNNTRYIILISACGILFSLVFILYRNNQQKQKAKIKIEKAYDTLKATQQQLIQSEKMASLGELTAGIAHEIQNPLNFVNNFSDVNKELADELEQEIDKGKFDDAKAIAKDIKDNEEKINHHGKRADSIVKGMLQHSRTNSGQKEPTDINALADEYLRLAYHGLRAKDKSFNATTKTEFDNSIGKINVAPQEVGRVILNLINNAFYAVDNKKKQVADGYEPTVTVSTKKLNDRIEVSVKDNGNGIPQKILDKIFQPFFTTKPTGQGTGLGLSLAYDIITKGHSGEIKVKTTEGQGTEFIVLLPV
jgi:signal transduction histidine kinase